MLTGKYVLAPPKDIAEVKNPYEIYEWVDKVDPYSVDNLLTAHEHYGSGLGGRVRCISYPSCGCGGQ